MEFEVQEDAEAAVAKLVDDAVAGGVVEFHAYLEPLAGAVEPVYKFQGLVFVGEVESYGEAVFGCDEFCGRRHDSSLANDDLLG